MSMYTGKHPVFVSHTKEIEQLSYVLADQEHRLRLKGLDSGKEFDCLLKVRARCSELLLRMAGEDSEIILVDDRDYWWVKNIVYFVHDKVLKDRKKTG